MLIKFQGVVENTVVYSASLYVPPYFWNCDPSMENLIWSSTCCLVFDWSPKFCLSYLDKLTTEIKISATPI